MEEESREYAVELPSWEDHFLPALQLFHQSPGSKTPYEISLSSIHVQTSTLWIAYLSFSAAGDLIINHDEMTGRESEVKKMLDDHLVLKNYTAYIQSSAQN